jgi:hypothetical protein
MIIPVGFAEVSFVWVGTGLPTGAMCSFGIENDTDAPAATIADVARTHYDTHIQPVCPVDITLLEVQAKKGPNATGADATLNAGLVGGGDITPVIPNMAALVKKNTNLGGRRGRGRMYLPFVTEGMHTSGGVLDPAAVTNLTDQMEDFRNAMETSALPLVLLHADQINFAPTTITSLAAQGVAATQRRRLRR